ITNLTSYHPIKFLIQANTNPATTTGGRRMKMLFSLILFSILGMPLYSGQHAKYEQWNQQGLSEGYHGHVEERIEEPYKHIQLLGINDFHGQLNVTRLVNSRPAGRADYLAAYLRKRAAENEN